MKNSLILAMLFTTIFNCRGQVGLKKNKDSNSVDCNRKVYGTIAYVKDLPKSICIPMGFIIDDYARTSDLDRDGANDFVAIKFNRREDDQIDGESTYWSFYVRDGGDTSYTQVKVMSNIVPPFISDISWKYLAENPLASKLFDEYPRRLSHIHSFKLSSDTIWLSYKFDDSYGKRFVFVYDDSDWYLESTEYFVGELPIYWWNDGEFWYPLNDALKVIETRKPNERVRIDKFDLKIAFRYREEESSHLADRHVNKIDEKSASSILQIEFKKCSGMELPEDWRY